MNLPIIDMVRTGQNINRLRKQAGLSVRDLQDIFGFATPQAIYKWQQGAALPTIDNLVMLAAVLQVRIDDILVVRTGNPCAYFRYGLLVTDAAVQMQIGA